MSGLRRRAGTRRVAGTLAAAVAVGAAATAATGFALRGGSADADPAGNTPPATVKVTRQTLVDTKSQNGTVGYGAAATVAGKLAGTVTALPAAGTRVERGQALYRLDDTPIVLLYGTLPAYRVLAPGVTGADVKQLEQNLYALGYRGFTVDDSYTASTATAVKAWQDRLNLAESGVVDPGRVVYAAGPVRVDADKAAVGDATQPGTPLLTYTGTDRLVTVDLDLADARLATADTAVTVTLPAGGTVAGKVTATATVVVPGSNGAADSTELEATVSLADQRALAGLDQASVSVAFTAAKKENVLTVPIAALLALAEGGYGVQVVDGGGSRIVAVQVGMFAAGRVEITGDGVAEGTVVGVPG